MKLIVPTALVTAALLAISTSSLSYAAAGAPDGATLFKQRCAVCHSDVAGQPARLGPNLAGVVGRKAAATGFNYSPALKATGLTWNKANLDRFLAAPAKTVPGTRMVIAVPGKAERDAIIAHLEKKR